MEMKFTFAKPSLWGMFINDAGLNKNFQEIEMKIEFSVINITKEYKKLQDIKILFVERIFFASKN
jgi:hypothetical protein